MEKTFHQRKPSIKRTKSNINRRQDTVGHSIPRTIKTTLFRQSQDGKPEVDNKCIFRLKRNNKTLLRLKRRLDSYVYEPRTPELFDRIEFLKGQIEIIRIKNSEIIGFLVHHRYSVGDYLDFVKYAFSNFYDLKRSIEEYMRDSRDGRLVS